jgi:hypothetical protein
VTTSFLQRVDEDFKEISKNQPWVIALLDSVEGLPICVSFDDDDYKHDSDDSDDYDTNDDDSDVSSDNLFSRRLTYLRKLLLMMMMMFTYINYK